MYAKAGLGGSLVHLDLVRVVDDDVELSEPSIVDHERCRRLHVVFDVMMSVHVGGGLPVARIPQQLHDVGDDGFVWVDVALASSRGRMFLNTGCISAKCACNASGTRTSHTIIQFTVPACTPVRICCAVIVHRACRRRGNAASRQFSRPGRSSCLSTRILTAWT